MRKNMDKKSFELIKLLVSANPKMKRAKIVDMVGFSESTIRRVLRCNDWNDFENDKEDIRKKVSNYREHRKNSRRL